MGPFGKFTSKFKGQQKEPCRTGKQWFDDLPKEHDEVPNSRKLEESGETKIHEDMSRVKCEVGKFDEKAQRKGSIGAGREVHTKDLSLLKEPSSALEKGTRRFKGKNSAAREEGKETPGVETDRIGEDTRLNSKDRRDTKQKSNVEESSYLSPCSQSPGRKSKDKLEQKGAREIKDFETMHRNQIVAPESSDLETSTLTRSLGLNRIKTRSGPLHEDDGMEGETELESRSLQSEKAKSNTGNIGKGHHEGSPLEAMSSTELKASNRSRIELLAAREQSKLNVSPYRDVEVTARSLQGKSRRKSKADPQRPQKGRSGRRTSVEMAMPVTGQVASCSIPVTSAADQAMGSSHLFSREHSNIPLKSDNILEKRVPSRLLSYLDNKCEKSFQAELDVIKETESAKFHSVPRVSEVAKLKKWPKDIKSFSHELGPRGGRAYDVPRPHSDNDLEELLASLRARFTTAKEEVDAELNLFAADLVEILDRNVDPFPQWQENVEDLLLLARRCTLLSPVDFRRECENIVHELDDRRQELPMGLLKQLHTRMLFILTRCTRLLQFQKETSPDEEGFHKIQQCLKGVPSLERSFTSAVRKKEKALSTTRKLLPEVLAQTARSDAGLSTVKSSKHARKPRFALEKDKTKNQQQDESYHMTNLNKLGAVISETFETSGNYEQAGKNRAMKTYDETALTQLDARWDQRESNKVDEDEVQPVTTSPSKQAQKTSWFDWADSENPLEESDSVICRICEEEVRTSHLQPHSLRCTLADACDVQGLNLNERLRMLADTLEKIAELNTPKSNQTAAEESPDGVKLLKLNLHEGFDNASPLSDDFQGKVIDSRYDEMCVSDTASVEELRGLSLISFTRLLGSKSDQGVASSSAGSGTPRSTLTTPRTSQLDLLWAERNSFTETEDISQIYELAGIARRIANRGPMEEGTLDVLESSLEELQDILARNKFEALTVDTFGRRIENLLREKLHLVSGAGDQRKLDFTSGLFVEDDGMSTDDGVQSFKSTPTHPLYRDRISIEDFEILKPISRGAFGRVFLARKRITGDLFAIKVLRKIDMIRKNAVENILAERDILITVCNPFVVRFFYSFTCRDNLYLVMEYLNGGDLYSLLRHMGCLDEHVARVYMAELVLALEYLHSLGVVHRDLKPDNILIARDGHIKLTDFGLSKVGLINSTDDLSGPGSNGAVLMEERIFVDSKEHIMQDKLRKERSAVGTPDYLAPEILLGTEHGYTADWWSVGAILFECLTGLPPFNAEHPQLIFDNILNRKIPWPHIPDDMSFEAKDLIDKLLTEDPNERLGAKWAREVKNHPFFKDISWDTLARQKAAFVPSPESVDDTSYFTSRHLEEYRHSSPLFADSSDTSTSCSSTSSMKAILNEGQDDECGDLADFGSSASVEHTFNNFSFKNLSQLASINYDLLLQTGKDPSKGHSRHQSAS